MVKRMCLRSIIGLILKRFSLFIAAIFVFIPAVNALPSSTLIGGGRCSDVLKICSRSKFECALAISWSAGFISGHNWSILLNDFAKVDGDYHAMDIKIPFEEIQTNLIKKCKANPSSTQVEETQEIMFDYYGQ